MVEFETDPKMEELLKMRASDPKKFDQVPKSQKKALADYETLKSDSELPANQRPKRRRFLSNLEKSRHISKLGLNSFLELPW